MKRWDSRGRRTRRGRRRCRHEEDRGRGHSLIKVVKLGQHTSNSRTHTHTETHSPSLAPLFCCFSANLWLVAAKAIRMKNKRGRGRMKRSTEGGACVRARVHHRADQQRQKKSLG